VGRDAESDDESVDMLGRVEIGCPECRLKTFVGIFLGH
jgi:hypothetical protein